MALPRVKIEYQNGALGAANPSPDGLVGLVVSAVAVASTFVLNTPYILNSYDDLATLGVTATNNPAVEKLVREFYAEAGAGTRVYLMGVAQTVSQADVLDYTKPSNARKLIEVSQGAIRGILVNHAPAAGYTPVIENGMNADVYAAIAKGQELGEWATDTYQAPIFIIVEGRDYTGVSSDLTDLTQMTNNRVGVLVGDTDPASKGAAMGLLAGRIAAIPVQRNIGRVKDGTVSAIKMYVAGTAVEQADVAGLNDKGFIGVRTFTGRVGYFFTDDPLAAPPTDDYHRLTYRRTVDKAYRIAYTTLLNELLDEVPATNTGQILPAYAKSWEQMVINAIATQMTANGELSADPADPNDRGVTCFIDPAQNVVATGKIQVVVRVRPFGYSRYIDVLLGFQITNA